MAIEQINETVESVKTVSGFIGKFAALLGSISLGVTKAMNFLAALGLSPLQTKIVIVVLFLIAFLAVLRFLRIVTKLLIFGLIAWVVASLVGLI